MDAAGVSPFPQGKGPARRLPASAGSVERSASAPAFAPSRADRAFILAASKASLYLPGLDGVERHGFALPALLWVH